MSGWYQASKVYLDRRVLSMMFLGFSSGLPFGVLAEPLSAWLAGSGVSKTSIGLLSLAKTKGPKVIGVTSAKNMAFVKDLDICDQIVDYDHVAAEIDQVPSVYVYIAGNSDVKMSLH